MDKELCLDTDFCIELLKRKDSVKNIEGILKLSSIYITSITMFELFLRSTNLDIVENFVDSINILYFDDFAAKIASEIYKDLKSKNIFIEIRDLFIAACAIANDCYLVTFNKKDFSHIKNLKLLDF